MLKEYELRFRLPLFLRSVFSDGHHVIVQLFDAVQQLASLKSRGSLGQFQARHGWTLDQVFVGTVDRKLEGTLESFGRLLHVVKRGQTCTGKVCYFKISNIS